VLLKNHNQFWLITVSAWLKCWWWGAPPLKYFSLGICFPNISIPCGQNLFIQNGRKRTWNTNLLIDSNSFNLMKLLWVISNLFIVLTRLEKWPYFVPFLYLIRIFHNYGMNWDINTKKFDFLKKVHFLCHNCTIVSQNIYQFNNFYVCPKIFNNCTIFAKFVSHSSGKGKSILRFWPLNVLFDPCQDRNHPFCYLLLHFCENFGDKILRCPIISFSSQYNPLKKPWNQLTFRFPLRFSN